jgi:probable HAF family extracellular repeat protein
MVVMRGRRPGEEDRTFLVKPGGRMQVVSFAPNESASYVRCFNDRGEILSTTTLDTASADPHAIRNVEVEAKQRRAGVNPAYRDYAMLWKGGKSTRIGPLPGHTDSEARGVNDRGQVVGWSYAPGSLRGDAAPNAGFVWERGRMRNLGDLQPDRINNRGQIVGRRGRDRFEWQAYVWEQGRLIPLGSLPGCARSEAEAMNDRGQVVGASMERVGDSSVLGFHERPHPFLWENGKIKSLELMPECTGGTAYGINYRGQVVGRADVRGRSNGGWGMVAFLYENGRMYDRR